MFKIIRLNGYSILRQLQIEESLYRNVNIKDNWLILNKGTPTPMIIVGASGKVDKLVDLDLLEKLNRDRVKQGHLPISIIKRYTGGGTVIVDENTIFCSMIMTKQFIHDNPIQEHLSKKELHQYYPKDIMKWSAEWYKHVFTHDQFLLSDNDYTFSDKKFGGNAQAFSRHKFVHHTSFLYDYDHNLMNLLKQPEKIPEYRQNRSHFDFLVKLSTIYPSKDEILHAIENSTEKLFGIKGNNQITKHDFKDFIKDYNYYSNTNQIYNVISNTWDNIDHHPERNGSS
ncbi:hypothetical protein DLAC_06203 [Tieghemostelium lacteum]|uniref:BPL/LPL catalytic domain-containing protein n=1 Tax=Tieghemostelium lacteum TaxID=361077 RepID=A0A151ZHQ8_TIELA|nr:hypothetical protein DLAC_06203 [Tieghemostelium lacteum]|eukprot:KYQ93506.1 hypothetical protein DLAC_06203 [Tieghemostelium lacteum]